jgi:hypothetical protein
MDKKSTIDKNVQYKTTSQNLCNCMPMEIHMYMEPTQAPAPSQEKKPIFKLSHKTENN